jgi:hypothetical protein
MQLKYKLKCGFTEYFFPLMSLNKSAQYSTLNERDKLHSGNLRNYKNSRYWLHNGTRSNDLEDLAKVNYYLM